MPFWQDFMLRILWLLGVKPDEVSRIDIRLEAGKLPNVTITRNLFSENEFRQITDVFEAAEWKRK